MNEAEQKAIERAWWQGYMIGLSAGALGTLIALKIAGVL